MTWWKCNCQLRVTCHLFQSKIIRKVGYGVTQPVVGERERERKREIETERQREWKKRSLISSVKRPKLVFVGIQTLVCSPEGKHVTSSQNNGSSLKAMVGSNSSRKTFFCQICANYACFGQCCTAKHPFFARKNSSVAPFCGTWLRTHFWGLEKRRIKPNTH